MRPYRRADPLDAAVTQEGISLRALSKLGPVLAIFLGALRGASCRAWLRGVAAARAAVEARGVRLALVHMGEDAEAAEEFATHGLQHHARIADPGCALYEAMALNRVAPGRLAGLRSLLGPRSIGDPLRMPGAFLFVDGAPKREHRGGELPDLDELSRPR